MHPSIQHTQAPDGSWRPGSARLRAVASRSAGLGALALCVAALAALIVAPAPTFAATPNFCPPGAAAGQCDHPGAVAVDHSTGAPTSGDVYVADQNNRR